MANCGHFSDLLYISVLEVVKNYDIGSPVGVLTPIYRNGILIGLMMAFSIYLNSPTSA